MVDKITKEEFILRSKEKHGDLYDYSKISSFKGMKYKVRIKCKIHGVFEIEASSHLYGGNGCTQCKGKRIGNIKDKLEFFVAKANKIHKNEYDYSLIQEYQGVMKKEPVICKIHGVWEVSLDNHINKNSGCPKCKGHGLTLEEKLIEAVRIHNNKYDYSLVIKNFGAKEKIPIICKEHGIFSQVWSNHLHQKHGCPKCRKWGRNKVTIEEIKERVLKLNTGFEYDWGSFKGYFKNLDIKCQKHGWFKQSISNHLFGQRCPKCNRSMGEENIANFLNKNKIKYKTQKTFEDCVNPKTNCRLRFDFFIPIINLCIEYDGELHYKSVKYFGGNEALEKSQYLDEIKNEYCSKNNINLLRIAYFDFKQIENILKIHCEI